MPSVAVPTVTPKGIPHTIQLRTKAVSIALIAQIQAGEFRPTPDEFVCGDCPALNLVCAGPRLRQFG